MTKMFDAMKEMIFAADAEVVGLRSNEKEEFDLEKPFNLRSLSRREARWSGGW